MKITLWGTRGSLASAGPENVRYGGNTACVEVRSEAGEVLVLDAGTGIRRLGAALNGKTPRVDVLLTHLHMDHILGLGFFAPLFMPGLEVHLWGPPSVESDLASRLTKYLSPPLFPVRLRDLPCRLALHEMPLEPFEIGAFTVRADFVSHPDPTLGYRVTEGQTAMAYLPDHEPALGGFGDRPPSWTSGYALAHGADLLIHDAQYTTAEYPDHIGWGHSALEHAIAFAVTSRARRLVTFHHDPSHSDEMLDRMMDEAKKNCSFPFEMFPGTEGLTVRLPASW